MTRTTGFRAAAAFLAFCATAPALAEPADPASPPAAAPETHPPATGCELHVWPSPGLAFNRQQARDNLDTSYMGGGVIGAMLATGGRERIENDTATVAMSSATTDGPMASAIQLQVLDKIGLTALLKLAGYHVTMHDTPLDNRTLRTVHGRYATDSTSPCYAELVLSNLVYSREYAHGQNLKSFLHFRDFGDRQLPVQRFATWIQTDLPHDREKAEVSAAELHAELITALDANLRKFADTLSKRP